MRSEEAHFQPTIAASRNLLPVVINVMVTEFGTTRTKGQYTWHYRSFQVTIHKSPTT